ncbi:MAG: CmcJ/NvfI family oxidoreductase [Halioglobus sp.]
MTDKDARNSLAVTAAINYVRNPPPAGSDKLLFVTENEDASTMQCLPGRQMRIHNGRSLSPSLDREGFRLLSHQSAISDFDGIEFDASANAIYMQEIEAIVREATGAAQTIQLAGVKQRFSETATEALAPLLNARPARYPHADNTDTSSREQIEFFVEHVARLKQQDFSRCALFNLWRCVSPPPQDCPLAVCDARSVTPEDELAVTAVTQVHGIGEVRHDTTSLTYNPNHNWYYFPDMQADEVILFKTHDTDSSRACRVAHTAFDDPGCPAGTHPRASVEARILAVFD